jgi:hypothetical protein
LANCGIEHKRPHFPAGAAAKGAQVITAIHLRKLALLAVLLLSGTAQLCWGHAILVDSTPKLSSTVKGPYAEISLRFNVRIDGGRSRVRLLAADGTTSTLALVSQSKPNILQTHAAGLKPGAYKLEWQVLASDGHMSRGEIPFTSN